jgi:hypothetical protein
LLEKATAEDFLSFFSNELEGLCCNEWKNAQNGSATDKTKQQLGSTAAAAANCETLDFRKGGGKKSDFRVG